jgi:AraC family cel operon transcriptional repressor
VAGIPTEWWKQGSPRGHRQLIVRHHAELSVILQALGSKAQGQALPLASTWKRLAEIFQTSGSNFHETLLPEWLKTWHHELSTVGPERLEEPIQIWQKRSGRSPEHLARSCRRHYGMTPSTLLNMARIEWVKQRLITSEEKVISLAIECGFNNMSHFHRLFTKHVGLTPSRWRHSHISTVPL